MRRLITTLAATLALVAPAPAYAAASWSAGDPTYQWCHHHRCTRARRAYRIRCGGLLWLSPRPVFVPRGFRHNPRARYECENIVPSFPWFRS